MSKLRQMEVFVAVVEAGSFAGAAAALGMSAVMVGRHVQSLEKTLNTRLVQRTTRRQTITGEGRIFYAEARTALEQVAYAYNRVEASSDAPSGLLRVTAPMTLGVSLVGPLVTEFMQRYPQVQVDANLVSQPLPPYQMVICAAPKYLEKAGEPKTPEALHAHRILTHTSWNNRFAWPLKQAGKEVFWPEQAVLRSNDGQVLLQAAIAGSGILMQPDFLVAAALANKELVSILGAYVPAHKPVQMVYPRSKKSLPKLTAFVAFIQARLGLPSQP